MLEVDEVAHRLDLGVVGQVLGQLHLRDGGALAVEGRDPLVHRLREHDRADALAERLDRGVVGGVERVEGGVGAGVLALDAEGAPHLLVVAGGERAEDERAVLDAVAGVVEAEGLAHGLRLLARLDRLLVGGAALAQFGDAVHRGALEDLVGDGHAADVAALEGERREQQRGLDELALAGDGAAVERRAHAHRRRQRGRVVGDGAARDRLRRAVVVDLALARHQPRVGLRHDVRAGALRVRPRGAVARALDVDEAGAEPRQRLVVDAEAVGDAGAGVAEEDVEVRDDAVDQLLRLRPLEVEADAALAAVEDVEGLALARRELADAPAAVALGRLDLHHVGAEVGEVHPRERPGHDLRQLQHAHPVERSRHRRPPLSPRAPSPRAVRGCYRKRGCGARPPAGGGGIGARAGHGG